MKKLRHRRLIRNHLLTTAEVLYFMPDHPSLLQSFIWQTVDHAPGFPVIQDFLSHWQENLEGRIHSVMVASRQLSRPAEFRLVGSSWELH